MPIDQTTCNHPAEAIRDGPRIRGRWGTHPTQVCSRCGAWRSTLHTVGPWRPGPIFKAADYDDEM